MVYEINEFEYDVNDTIKFINAMESNLNFINRAQKNIIISLIINIVLVNLITIFYIKNSIIIKNNLSNFQDEKI